MWQPKHSNFDNPQTQVVTKWNNLNSNKTKKKLNYDKTQKLKLWKNPTQTVTKLKKQQNSKLKTLHFEYTIRSLNYDQIKFVLALTFLKVRLGEGVFKDSGGI